MMRVRELTKEAAKVATENYDKWNKSNDNAGVRMFANKGYINQR